MSFTAITRFFQQVSQDPTLKTKVQDALDQRAEAAAFEIVKIARDRDLEFSATELRQYLAGEESDAELSEDQLEAVAGGLRYVRTTDLAGLRKIRTISLTDLRTARRLNDGRI